MAYVLLNVGSMYHDLLVTGDENQVTDWEISKDFHQRPAALPAPLALWGSYVNGLVTWAADRSVPDKPQPLWYKPGGKLESEARKCHMIGEPHLFTDCESWLGTLICRCPRFRSKGAHKRELRSEDGRWWAGGRCLGCTYRRFRSRSESPVMFGQGGATEGDDTHTIYYPDVGRVGFLRGSCGPCKTCLSCLEGSAFPTACPDLDIRP